DTPLHVAVAGGSAAVVRAVLTGGADPERPNHAGDTPLAAADRARQERVRWSLSVRRSRGEAATLFSLGPDLSAVLREAAGRRAAATATAGGSGP
ncbi:MAG TPA: hypothetical protein VF796_02235, partial [Humisphaera sp.]